MNLEEDNSQNNLKQHWHQGYHLDLIRPPTATDKYFFFFLFVNRIKNIQISILMMLLLRANSFWKGGKTLFLKPQSVRLDAHTFVRKIILVEKMFAKVHIALRWAL